MSYAKERLAEINGAPVKLVPLPRKPHYVLRITGIAMDTQILINDPEDMEIVDAVIRKLRRAVVAPPTGEPG